MTTTAPLADTVDEDRPLSQHQLAKALATAIDAVRDAVTSDAWIGANVALAQLVERAPSRDACRTPFVRNQIGRRAEWLDRWLDVR